MKAYICRERIGKVVQKPKGFEATFVSSSRTGVSTHIPSPREIKNCLIVLYNKTEQWRRLWKSNELFEKQDFRFLLIWPI